MKPEMAQILVECRLREMIVEDAINHRFCNKDEEEDWLIQVEHGPHYSACRWFGISADADRMRYCRALKELVAMGLVQRCVDAHSGRVLNIALTDEGKRRADAIGG